MRILIDVDGVLADLTQAVCDGIRFHSRGRYSPTPADVTSYDFSKVFSSEEMGIVDMLSHQVGFARSLDWYMGARTALERLVTLGEVHAVTRPWKSETWCWEREEWLLPFIQKDRVCHVRDKSIVAGDFLIEDNLDNVEAWQKVHEDGVALLIDRPWNRKQEPRKSSSHKVAPVRMQTLAHAVDYITLYTGCLRP